MDSITGPAPELRPCAGFGVSLYPDIEGAGCQWIFPEDNGMYIASKGNRRVERQVGAGEEEQLLLDPSQSLKEQAGERD
jgi:hypothetical protein